MCFNTVDAKCDGFDTTTFNRIGFNIDLCQTRFQHTVDSKVFVSKQYFVKHTCLNTCCFKHICFNTVDAKCDGFDTTTFNRIGFNTGSQAKNAVCVFPSMLWMDELLHPLNPGF